MESVKLIKDLCAAFGPSGFEDDVLAVAEKYVPPGYRHSRDSLMNFYVEKENADDKPVVLLDAHTDEIGLMVQAIRDDGCITFATLGGWVPSTLSGQRMAIRNTAGELVMAVIAAHSSHVGGSEAPDIEKMILDIGASNKSEVSEIFKIAPGCPVVPVADFVQQGDIMIAKAFDDRIGCAAVLETLSQLAACDLPVNISAALTSQEEVGLRGAKVAANRTLPDMAICFEGAPADDTAAPGFAVQTAMGEGPMVRIIDASMIANPRVVEFTKNVAAKHDIPVQFAVRKRGGTNGAAYQLSQLGVPVLVISVPTRYAHSHNSICRLSDYENAVRLAVTVIRELNYEAIAGF